MAAPTNADKKQRYPQLEQDWQTANRVAKKYKASSETWYAHMADLKADQIRIRMNNYQESLEDAAQYVNTHLVGMRCLPKGPATLAVSPEGFTLLPRHRNHPPLDDWLTSRMLKKRFGGADATWRKHLKALQTKLIEERASETGELAAEARAYVQKHCIGVRKPKHGVPALAINPGIINRLPELEFAPPMPDGWQTGHMMMVKRRGDGATWTKRIEKEAQEMAEDLTGWQGITAEEAEKMVHASIADKYQHHTEPSWAASPDLQRHLIEKYPVKQYKPRNKKPGDDSPTR